jgi:broad specificity phosphatase PhoE
VIILARHGQTEANAQGRLLGRLDLSLNDVGHAQAKAVATCVGTVERVVCSPLQRCQQTAAAFGVPVEIDERWIEMDYGVWDGVPLASITPEQWAHFRSSTSYTPPKGESLAAVGRRVRDACGDLLEDARGRDVVVVSHVSPIKAAVAWALDVGDEVAWRLFLDVASICRIGVGSMGPTLRTFNDTGHLTGVC